MSAVDRQPDAPAELCVRSPYNDRILEAAEGFAAITRQAEYRTAQFERQWNDIMRSMAPDIGASASPTVAKAGDSVAAPLGSGAGPATDIAHD